MMKCWGDKQRPFQGVALIIVVAAVVVRILLNWFAAALALVWSYSDTLLWQQNAFCATLQQQHDRGSGFEGKPGGPGDECSKAPTATECRLASGRYCKCEYAIVFRLFLACLLICVIRYFKYVAAGLSAGGR